MLEQRIQFPGSACYSLVHIWESDEAITFVSIMKMTYIVFILFETKIIIKYIISIIFPGNNIQFLEQFRF